MESTELPATLTAIAEDYGPPGCALQSNIVDLWRKHFVLQEDMLELYCTILTPEDDIFNSIKSFINGKERGMMCLRDSEFWGQSGDE